MGEKSITEYKLADLQKKWRIEKDEKAYQEMFELLVQYSRSLILKMTKGKKFLNPDYVFSKAVDCAIVFLEQYTKNPEFMIDFSFGGVLRYKVLEVLYGPKNRKDDRILSLNSLLQNASSEKELEDLQERLDMKPFWSSEQNINDPVYEMYHTEETTIKTVLSVIHDLKTTLYLSNRDMMIIMLAFLHLFRKSKILSQFKEKYFNRNELKEIFDLSLLEIRNRLYNEV